MGLLLDKKSVEKEGVVWRNVQIMEKHKNENKNTE